MNADLHVADKVKSQFRVPAAMQKSGGAVDESNMCIVYDMNATEHGKKRYHVIDGRTYALSADPDEPCTVPLAHALKFLQDPSFKVFDSDGNLMEMLRSVAHGGQALQPHQCIATYAELTKEALLSRAMRMPNGATMNQNTPKERLIEFVMAGGVPAGVNSVEPTEEEVAGELEDDDNPSADLGG